MTVTTQVFQGGRLRLGRLVNGLSMAEVGALVRASRQHIFQLESGAKTLGPSMTEALADALGVLPAFLTRPIRNEVDEQ